MNKLDLRLWSAGLGLGPGLGLGLGPGLCLGYCLSLL